ncbi:MAG: hypothetical protein SPJ13_06015 [Bacteroidales bacterium]|nr:hypothetical protein [Bacteroidales bacterium]
MRLQRNIGLACASLLLLAGCKPFEGGQTVPAYLSIDRITVENTPGNSVSQMQGYFSSLIDCAEVIIYVNGDTSQTNLGVYELPCCIPILRSDTIDKVIVNPVVKQNGIAATHIDYPYYSSIELDKVFVAPNDTTSLGSLTTHYVAQSHCVWEEFFEPGAQGLNIDSIVHRLLYNQAGALDTILSDNGCGVVHVSQSQEALNFWSKDTIDMSRYGSESYLYLEMDYWTDFNLSVGFNNPTMVGGTSNIHSAIVLYPNQGWQKIYINLGRLWSYYNHHPYIRLYFSILNSGHLSGNVYLDNMKLLVY